LSEWAPYVDTVTEVNEAEASLANLEPGRSSFLKGIPQRYLQEEPAIHHDLFNWPVMTPLHGAGISVFEQGNRHLEVHTPIEMLLNTPSALTSFTTTRPNLTPTIMPEHHVRCETGLL
jgi:hypothetical protein